MTSLDRRVACCAVAAGLVAVVAPIAFGGFLLVVGIVGGILIARSAVRGDEGDVTTAIVAGGVVTAMALTRGHVAALACAAGVFVGAELAALGRRLDATRDASMGPEVAVTARTIAVGAVAGAEVAIAAMVPVGATAANAALAAVIVLGAGVLAFAHRRDG